MRVCSRSCLGILLGVGAGIGATYFCNQRWHGKRKPDKHHNRRQQRYSPAVSHPLHDIVEVTMEPIPIPPPPIIETSIPQENLDTTLVTTQSSPAIGLPPVFSQEVPTPQASFDIYRYNRDAFDDSYLRPIVSLGMDSFRRENDQALVNSHLSFMEDLLVKISGPEDFIIPHDFLLRNHYLIQMASPLVDTTQLQGVTAQVLVRCFKQDQLNKMYRAAHRAIAEEEYSRNRVLSLTQQNLGLVVVPPAPTTVMDANQALSFSTASEFSEDCSAVSLHVVDREIGAYYVRRDPKENDSRDYEGSSVDLRAKFQAPENFEVALGEYVDCLQNVSKETLLSAFIHINGIMSWKSIFVCTFFNSAMLMAARMHRALTCKIEIEAIGDDDDDEDCSSLSNTSRLSDDELTYYEPPTTVSVEEIASTYSEAIHLMGELFMCLLVPGLGHRSCEDFRRVSWAAYQLEIVTNEMRSKYTQFFNVNHSVYKLHWFRPLLPKKGQLFQIPYFCILVNGMSVDQVAEQIKERHITTDRYMQWEDTSDDDTESHVNGISKGKVSYKDALLVEPQNNPDAAGAGDVVVADALAAGAGGDAAVADALDAAGAAGDVVVADAVAPTGQFSYKDAVLVGLQNIPDAAAGASDVVVGDAVAVAPTGQFSYKDAALVGLVNNPDAVAAVAGGDVVASDVVAPTGQEARGVFQGVDAYCKP